MGIVRFALRFPHTFYVVTALILFLGITASIKTRTDIFPEIDIPVVMVIWTYTGLSTPEMEQRVCGPSDKEERPKRAASQHAAHFSGRISAPEN
jgi:multidrug efflux pump subunit AcrB